MSMQERHKPATTLFWFGRDLRLDDNPALAYAAEQSDALLCVYCHDESLDEIGEFGFSRQGPVRRQFIGQCLSTLAFNLAQQGQALLQVEGPPVAKLQALIDEYRVECVVRSRQFGFYEERQWQRLQLHNPAVDFVEIDSYTLFTCDQVDAFGELPATFSQFRRRAERTAIHPPVRSCRLSSPPAGAALPAPVADSEVTIGARFVGGEAAAEAHVTGYFAAGLASTYKETRNALDGWAQSSKMSPWLASGCLSSRRLYQRLKRYEAEQGANDSTYWIYIELLWREYFQWYAAHHAQRLFLPGGITGTNPVYEFDAGRFAAWCAGETRWPLINACMKQLERTGYLSNRARQIAASVLINELELDWRAGAAWFERQLIDHDVAANWGNWQYIAGVGADPRGGRHFSIEKQARLFDADGSYVARWLGPMTGEAVA